MSENILQNILTRRSVRAYKQDPVPEELLDKVLEAGTYAPTGMGRQSPVIVAVKDKPTRDKLMKMNAAVMGTDNDPYYGAPVIVWCWRTKPRIRACRTQAVCWKI